MILKLGSQLFYDYHEEANETNVHCVQTIKIRDINLQIVCLGSIIVWKVNVNLLNAKTYTSR